MALSDAQFTAWLASASSIRTVLVEAVARIAGSETTLYLSNRNYTTGSADTPASTAYTACIVGGVSTTESLNLDGSPSMSWGDIEIGNADGSRDGWLDYVWANRAVAVYVGDPTWPRADFRLVFSGVVDDIGSRARDVLNLKLRDKLERLNAPLTETTLGGSTDNKDRLIPVVFGEVHNIEPLLVNPATLVYQYSTGAAERLIEVRDNGAPITTYTSNLSASQFTLTAAPVGQITCDVQGVKPSGTYRNDIGRLVQYIVQNYGPSATRFSSGDLDATQLAAFVAACPQAVGRYCADRENVLALCQELAASVGAQVVVTSTGLLRLIRLALPATGTPTSVTAADMDARSLAVSERPAVKATARLGYALNATPQTSGLAGGLPASSASALGQAWLTVTSTDATTASTYKLDAQPPQADTLLIDTTEATAEADRRRDLWKTPRAIYTATYRAHLMLVELGDTWTLTHARFGLAAGKTGLVVSIERDWIKGRVAVGVLA